MPERNPAKFERNDGRNGPFPVSAPNTSDFEVIRQVFEQQGHNAQRLRHGPKLPGNYERILSERGVSVDLNIDATSLNFASWAEARSASVNPAVDDCELMRDNFPAYGQITWAELAPPNMGSPRSLIEAKEKWAYRAGSAVSGPNTAVSVPSPLTSIDNEVPFITKIGIEGAEAELFSKYAKKANGFVLLVIELNDRTLPPCGSRSLFRDIHAGLNQGLTLAGDNIYPLSIKL